MYGILNFRRAIFDIYKHKDENIWNDEFSYV